MKGTKSASTTNKEIKNVQKWAAVLKEYAEGHKIDEAKALLNKHKHDIQKLSENHSAIIECFYPPYTVAYENGDLDFCREYQNAIDQLTGVDSIFFVDEY